MFNDIDANLRAYDRDICQTCGADEVTGCYCPNPDDAPAPHGYECDCADCGAERARDAAEEPSR